MPAKIKIIRAWVGPLPQEHIWISPSSRPKNLRLFSRLYSRKWFIHPIKRRLAKYYLLALEKFFGLKVIAITGSVGKTTTKDILYSILAGATPTVSSFANIDPVYNIPTTILRCRPSTRYLILEMGIEFLGEMDFYLWLARPDIAIITAISLSHTEFLKDIKTVASEKGKIGRHAKQLVVNADDQNIQIKTSGEVYKVKSSTRLSNFPLLGSHFGIDIALASKTAALLGFSPQQISNGIKKFSPPPHRMQLIRISSGATLIDDTYNASPLATRAAIDALVNFSKSHHLIPVFVFGQMNELGSYEKSAHKEIGRYVLKKKIKYLFTIGPATLHTIKAAHHGKHFENAEKLLLGIRPYAQSSKFCLLIKASRSWHLEEVVDKLVKQ